MATIKLVIILSNCGSRAVGGIVFNSRVNFTPSILKLQLPDVPSTIVAITTMPMRTTPKMLIANLNVLVPPKLE